MLLQMVSQSVGLTTCVADVWFLTIMDQFMSIQVASMSEGLNAEFTDVCFLTTMNQFMLI